MDGPSGAEHVETVIVGGGQAGLSVGYHLARRGRRFVILDANQRIGDPWRRRWDSLRLFTPARYDGLPGWPFPAPAWSFPTKDEQKFHIDGGRHSRGLPLAPSGRRTLPPPGSSGCRGRWGCGAAGRCSTTDGTLRSRT
jgi:putative flavoprotein involved in K+ transport